MKKRQLFEAEISQQSEAEVLAETARVYLNFNGAVTAYRGEAATLDEVIMRAADLPESTVPELLARLNKEYRGAVIFVSEPPPAGVEFSTVHIGYTDSFAALGDFSGLAETIDAGNLVHDDQAFVILRGGETVGELRATIAHETDHIVFGATHAGEGIAAYAADYSGGTVPPAVTLNPGDTATSMTVNSGGTLMVSQSATVRDSDIFSGGTIRLLGSSTALASAFGTEIHSGGKLSATNAFVSGTVIGAGGSMNFMGPPPNPSLPANPYAANVSAVIQSGGTLTQMNAVASSVRIESGGLMQASGGMLYLVGNTVLGGRLEVLGSAAAPYPAMSSFHFEPSVLTFAVDQQASPNPVSLVSDFARLAGPLTYAVSVSATQNGAYKLADNFTRTALSVTLQIGGSNSGTLQLNSTLTVGTREYSLLNTGNTLSLQIIGEEWNRIENLNIVNSVCLLNRKDWADKATVSGGNGYLIVASGAKSQDTQLRENGRELVGSGGISFNTVVSNGIQMLGGSLNGSQYGGGVASGTIVWSGAAQEVRSGGSAFKTAVSGQQYVDAAHAESATVYSGGRQSVGSGGSATATTVSNGGSLFVGGGTINGATIHSGGSLVGNSTGDGAPTLSGTIHLGGTLDGSIRFTGNATLNFLVSERSVADSAIISAYSLVSMSPNDPFSYSISVSARQELGEYKLIGDCFSFDKSITLQVGETPVPESLTVGNSVVAGTYRYSLAIAGGNLALTIGYASDKTIYNDVILNGSSLDIGSNTIANRTQVRAGTLTVRDGGLLNSTSIINSGLLFVSSGGTDLDADIQSGGRALVFSGGIARRSLISSGGRQIVGGLASISSGTNTSFGGGLVEDVTLAGGYQELGSGGSALRTTISSGGQQNVGRNATATSTTVSNGGIQILYNGRAEHTAVLSGGELKLADYSDSSYVSGAVVSNGGRLTILSGGVLENIVIHSGGSLSAIQSGSGGSQTPPVLSGRIELGGTIDGRFSGNAEMMLLVNERTVTDSFFFSYWNVVDPYQDAMSYTVNVAANQATGNYQLISNGFRKESISIACDRTIIGALTINSSIVNGNYRYSLVSLNDVLTLAVGDKDSKFVYSNLTLSGDSWLNSSLAVKDFAVASSVTVNSGGILSLEGGSATSVTVNNGGLLTLTSGSAASTVLNSGGVESVCSGAVDRSAQINSGGSQYVGGVAEGAAVNSSGLQSITFGGAANRTRVNTSGRQEIQSGGHALSASVMQYGSQTVLSGGTATSTRLGGTLNISSGGTAFEASVEALGRINLDKGGVLSNAVIASGGLLLGSGTLDGTVTVGGRLQGNFSGTANIVLAVNERKLSDTWPIFSNVTPIDTFTFSVTVSAAQELGNYQLIANGAALSSPLSIRVLNTVHSGTLAVDDNIVFGNYRYSLACDNKGILTLSVNSATAKVQWNDHTLAGGSSYRIGEDTVANRTVLSSGGSLFIQSGGTANSTTIRQYGEEYVSGGGHASNTVISGGMQFVGSGFSGGVASDTKLISGTQFVQSGGTAVSAIVSANAYQTLQSGGIASGTILSGGIQEVERSVASDTVICNGGRQSLFSSGTAIRTVVSSGGSLNVGNAANASGTEVHSGGTLHFNGGNLSDTVIYAGGALLVSGSAMTLGGKLTLGDSLVHSAGVIECNNAEIVLAIHERSVSDNTLLSLDNLSGAYSLAITVGAAQAAGDYQLANTAAFSSSVAIRVAGTAESDTLSLNGNAVVFGDRTFKLMLHDTHKYLYLNVKVEEEATYKDLQLNTLLTLESAQTALRTTILSSGTLDIQSGATATSTTISAFDAFEYVRSGGISENAIIYTGSQLVGDQQRMISGGVASGTVISGGMQNIALGGITHNTIVADSRARQQIQTGGTAYATQIQFGSQFVGWGGRAENTDVRSGAIQSALNGTMVSSFIHSGGILSGFGILSGTLELGGLVSAINSGFSGNATVNLRVDERSGQESSAMFDWGAFTNNPNANFSYAITVAGTQTSGEYLLVTNAAQCTRDFTISVLNGDPGKSLAINSSTVIGQLKYTLSRNPLAELRLRISNANAPDYENEVISSGGSLTLTAQTAVNTTVRTSGTLTVAQGGIAGNTKLFGGLEIVLSGGSTRKSDIRENGLQQLSGGIAESATLCAQGRQTVFSGGSALQTEINFYGLQAISSGGYAENTRVNQNADQHVYTSGTASGTSVGSGGRMFVYAGTAIGAEIQSGGSAEVNFGGATTATEIQSGGVLSLKSGSMTDTIIRKGGTLTLLSSGSVVPALLGYTRVAGTCDFGNLSSGVLQNAATLELQLNERTADDGVLLTNFRNYSLASNFFNITITVSALQATGSYRLFETYFPSDELQFTVSAGTETRIITPVSQPAVIGDRKYYLDYAEATSLASLVVAGLNDIRYYDHLSIGSGNRYTSRTMNHQETARNATITSQGVMILSSGGAAENTQISSGTLTILRGGYASGTVLSYGAIEQVASWNEATGPSLAVAEGTIVSGGSQQINSGGIARATVVERGMLNIDNGGSAWNAQIRSGGGAMLYGGTLDGLTVASGGRLTGSGTVTGRLTVAGSWNVGSNTLVAGNTTVVMALAERKTTDSEIISGPALQLKSDAVLTMAISVAGAQLAGEYKLMRRPDTNTFRDDLGFTVDGVTGAGVLKQGETLDFNGRKYAAFYRRSIMPNEVSLVFKVADSIMVYDSLSIDETMPLTLRAGDRAENAAVRNRGELRINSGGVASAAIMTQYGLEQINSGGSSIRAVVSANGSQLVNGGEAFGALIGSGGSQTVSANGITLDTVVSSGTQTVDQGGSAFHTTLTGGPDTSANGLQAVNAGGYAEATLISEGGTQRVSGGVAMSAVVRSKGSQSVAGGSAIATTIHSGGTQFVGPEGYADLTAVNGGNMTVERGTVGSAAISSGGKAQFNSATVNGTVTVTDGNVTVYGGITTGSAGRITLAVDQLRQDNSDAMLTGIEVTGVAARTTITVSPAQRIGIYKLADNAYHISSLQLTVAGGVETLTLSVDGAAQDFSYRNYLLRRNADVIELIVEKSITPAHFENITVTGNTVLTLLDGEQATGTALTDGGELLLVSGAIASGSLIGSGGRETVTSGGESRDAAIRTGGNMIIATGGVAAGAVINAPAPQRRMARLAATAEEVSSGAELRVQSGGTARDTIVNSGGLMTLEAGAILAGTNTFGGTVAITGNVNATAANVVFAVNQRNTADGVIIDNLARLGTVGSFAVTVAANQLPGNYQLAGGASDFTGAITVKGATGTELGPVTVGGKRLISGAYGYTLTQDAGILALKVEACPSQAYVNCNWTGRQTGDIVTLSGGGTAVFGVNAFSNLSDAGAMLLADGTLTIDADIPAGTESYLALQGKSMAVDGGHFGIVSTAENAGIYGGGDASAVASTALTVSGGTFSVAVFGGGRQHEVTGTAAVTVRGGTLDLLYGGGNGATATRTEVRFNGGSVYKIFGGGKGAAGTVTQSTHVSVTAGNVYYVYAGADQGTVSGDVQLDITGGTIQYVTGGGNGATVGGNVIVNTATASFTNTYYGGGVNTAVHGKIMNTVGTGAQFARAYHAGVMQQATCGITVGNGISTVINGGSFANILSGGNYAMASQAYANVVNNGITLSITGGTFDKGNTMIFTGGYARGNQSLTGHTDLTVNGGVRTDISGGEFATGIHAAGRGVYLGAFANLQAQALITGGATLTVTGGTLTDLHGGGWAQNTGSLSTIRGNVLIDISGGSMYDVYGGGNHGSGARTLVDGNVTIKVSGGTIGNLYASGKYTNDTVSGNTEIVFTGSNTLSVGTVSGFGKSGDDTVGGSTTLAFDHYTGVSFTAAALVNFDTVRLRGVSTVDLLSDSDLTGVNNWDIDLTGRSAADSNAGLLQWNVGTNNFNGDTIDLYLETAQNAQQEWSLIASTPASGILTGLADATYNLHIDNVLYGTLTWNGAISDAGCAFNGWGVTEKDNTLKFSKLA